MSDKLTAALSALQAMKIPEPSQEERLWRDYQWTKAHAEDEFESHAKVVREWLVRYFRRSLPKGFRVSYVGRGYNFWHGARKRGEVEVNPHVLVQVTIPSAGEADTDDSIAQLRRRRGISSQHIELHYYPLASEDLRAWAKKWRDWLGTAPVAKMNNDGPLTPLDDIRQHMEP